VLETRAEILKLARLLRRDPADLDYLEQIPAQDIRALRELVTDVLFESGGGALARLAAASKVLPVGLVATIGQRSFGPVLSARITGLLEPSRAVQVADRLPVEFLADIAVELDPRRASEVVARIPPHRIAEVTRELVRRREYVTMGWFVGHLDDEAVLAAVAVMDDATLLQVAFVLECKDGLDHLLDLIGPSRLDAVIGAAARENLWVEVLGLLSNVSEARRLELAEKARVRELDPAQLETIAERARAAGLSHELELLEAALGGQSG
jgi:hypothetical protein